MFEINFSLTYNIHNMALPTTSEQQFVWKFLRDC